MTSFDWVGSLDAWLPSQRATDERASPFGNLATDSFRGTAAKPVPIPKRPGKDSTQSSRDYFRSMSATNVGRSMSATRSLLSFFGAETSMCPTPAASEQQSCDSPAHSFCGDEDDDEDDILAMASSLSPSEAQYCLLDWRPCQDTTSPGIANCNSSDCCAHATASPMHCSRGALSQLLAESLSTSAPSHTAPSLASAASLPVERSFASISLASLCTALSSPIAKAGSLAAAPTQPACNQPLYRNAADNAATVALATNAFEHFILPLSQLQPIACSSLRPHDQVHSIPEPDLNACVSNQRSRCVAPCQLSAGVPSDPWAVPISSVRVPVAVWGQGRATDPWRAVPISRSYVV